MNRRLERFPRVLSPDDELPGQVIDAIHRHQPDACIQRIVLIPPQDYAVRIVRRLFALPFLWRTTPQRTIAFGCEQITVVEEVPDGTLHTISIALDTLIDIEIFTILLYAYLEFTWIEEGAIQHLQIEFNSVGERLIRQGVNDARAAISGTLPTVPDLHPSTLIDAFPLKFYNYLHYSLLDGEQVRAAVFQPAIRREGRRFRPTISPNRTIAITDRHLIVLEEQLQHAVQQNYSIITHFYPLGRVRHIGFDDMPDAVWMRLHVGLEDVTQEISLPLQPACADLLRQAFTIWT